MDEDGLTGEHGRNGVPALAHVLRRGKDEDFESGVAGVDAMVEELAQRSRLSRASPIYHQHTYPHPTSPTRNNSRLRPIDSIKSLIQEQADSPAIVHPGRAVLVQHGRVPQQGREVGDDEGEAGQGDGVGRHAHGEALDDEVRVEGLEDVLAGQRAVDRRVLVLLERGELPLADVDHRCGASGG